MKRLSFLCITMLSVGVVYSQSQTLKGTILPNVKGGNVILPNSSTTSNSVSSQSNNIVLVGGSMDPTKSGNVILQKNNKPNYATDPQVVPLANGSYAGAAGPILFQGPPSKRKVAAVTTDPQKVATTTNNNLGSLTDNSFRSLTDDYSIVSLTSSNTSSGLPSLTSSAPTTIQNSSAAQQLAPLTDIPQRNTVAKVYTSKSVETVDPSLMNLNKAVKTNSSSSTSTNNSSATYNYSTPKYKMPPLALIDGKSSVGITSKSSMPELAPIEGLPTQNTNKSGMPELAPIEGESIKSESKSGMPELAAIEDENSAAVQQQTQQIVTPKVKTNLRGFTMPTGTTLSSKNNRSFIFKPAVPVIEEVIEKKEDTEEMMSTKPSAGGGMGIPALAPIEVVRKKEEVVSELAPMDYSNTTIFTSNTPALAPIKNYQQPPQSKVNYSPQSQQDKLQKLQQAAKDLQNDPNTPYKVEIIYTNKTAPKKVAAKKPVYRRKTTYRQPQTVVYEYRQAPQPTQTSERIVYVPIQQQYNQPQPKQQVTYQPTQQVTYQPQQKVTYQPQPAPAKQQQKVVYRDYTNTYTKTAPPTNNCNCPGSNQQQKVLVNRDGKKYYNPNNYASGLSAGPTSGDYPTSGSSSEVDMRYTFYLNPRGKYSVGLYNDYCTILLSQNGQVKEYKINGDPSLDPNSYKPRLNYFGSPDNVAGIPIEYNYNRSVHKIGNIKFDYDFEGFFKTVNTSTVLYTSRSSLQKVDDINVYYDQSGNVTSVDPNNGLIQFNPN